MLVSRLDEDTNRRSLFTVDHDIRESGHAHQVHTGWSKETTCYCDRLDCLIERSSTDCLDLSGAVFPDDARQRASDGVGI